MGTNVQKRGRQSDPIVCSKTFYSPNAIVHVHFPDISDEENERRMNLIKTAAVDLIKEQIRSERKAREEQAKQQ